MIKPNYRIVKLGGKYYPMVRQPQIVNGRWIHEWSYFKATDGNSDLHFDSHEAALKACLDADKTETFDEVTDICISNGEVVAMEKVYSKKERN